MRIQLDEDRTQTIIRSLVEFYRKEFDEEISPFRAERLLKFFMKVLGPPVYNQAIQDARSFMIEKLDDLDAEFFEREEAVKSQSK